MSKTIYDLKTETFIANARKIHGDKYDYSKSHWTAANNKITIICPTHGEFYQIPRRHTGGRFRGCPACGVLKTHSSRVKKSADSFVKRANKIHLNKYTYANTVYKKSSEKLNVTCRTHGDFSVIGSNHLRGSGCPICAKLKTAKLNTHSTKEFIQRAKEVHGEIYSYANTVYKKSSEHLHVTCVLHGDFSVSPNNHLHGHGCPPCGKIKAGKSNAHSTAEFIHRARAIHGDLYSYVDAVYKLNNIKVIIKCSTHGDFMQTPMNHFSGNGCPRCSASKGENIIAGLLNDNNIKFVIEKTFSDLVGTAKRKKVLPYDFYLPERNILIEFDGTHHFAPVRFNGKSLEAAKIAFDKTVAHDKIKNQYATDNGIILYRIPHYENVAHRVNEIIASTVTPLI